MSRRYRRRRHHRRSHYHSRKQAGWGMNLYRNTRESRVAGVCAGLADHWDVAHWVVRLLWVGAFLFTGTLALWVYVAAWIMLAPRPSRREADYHAERAGTGREDSDYREPDVEMEYDEDYHEYRPRKVFRYSDSAGERLRRARERLDEALRRVEGMESYVTSRRYNLNKEFSQL